MTLKDIQIGESVKIVAVGGDGALRQHFLDMGVIPEAVVTVEKLAPMGDPMELLIHGYELTIRLDDAAKIEVVPFKNEKKEKKQNKNKETRNHPGLGEGGIYHDKKNETPLDDDTILTFALVGNQNSGKTTLFNCLTGANQHVGNFPGVTVERKDGAIKGHSNTLVVDLPGIYSMSPYSNEELVSRDFVLKEKPCAIINIVDTSNIERNLYLTMQLLEMNIPMVVALNMMDEVRNNGGSVDINTMEALLGVPVIPISAAKNEGIEELVNHAIHVAHYQEKPLRQDFCDENDKGGAVHRCLHAVCHLIEDHAKNKGIPVRFAASKLIENDKNILEQLELDQNEIETLEHIVIQLEKERELDRSAAIADMRFSFIYKLCDKTVTKPSESKERIRSRKIDRVLTGKYSAIPMFIAIMGLIFWLTFNVIGAFLQGLLESGVDFLTESVDNYLTVNGVNELLHGLIIKGIFAGVGSVLSFLPIIVILFFFLSILEDSGYIARVAFFMDKILRKIGLSGRSIVPLLIGFGCTVPAVMATRTLPSARDRKMTILLTPFMSCMAKMPIYWFFIGVFFPNKGLPIIVGLYVLGILIGIIIAAIYKRTIFKGEAVPFVMELPNYRFPSAKNVMRLLWDKAKDFLQRAFSVIFIATIVVWFLSNLDMNLKLTDNPSQSILSSISGLLVPIFKPLGLGDWRICTALISGFIAKESVVSSLEVLFPGSVQTSLSALSAACLLVFSLLYTPCVAAIASVKRELGSKWAVGLVLWQCIVAWTVTFVFSIILRMFL